MNIGLDFDGTMKRTSKLDEREVAMWRKIIEAFQEDGHAIYVTTLRTPQMDAGAVEAYVAALGIPLEIVWCSLEAKRTVCQRRGIKIDIWIDDMPECIATNY